MGSSQIGVFDSGLGGLTCVKQLQKLLPHENILYLGDSGRVPYGTRSHETILRYSRQGASLLLSKGVKAIISACGTISSVAGASLAQSLPIPYFEVITPAAKSACSVTKTGRIGVMGTSATIKSGALQNAIKSVLPDAEVFPIACPLLIPMVESGHISPDDKLVQVTLELYLSQLASCKVDTVVLGCTHFPILSEAIGRYFGDGVTLVDSGRTVAEEAASALADSGILNDRGEGSVSCLVTDSPDGFSAVAEIFLGQNVNWSIKQIDLSEMEGMKL